MYVFVCFICNVNHAVDHFCDNITLFSDKQWYCWCAGLEGGFPYPPRKIWIYQIHIVKLPKIGPGPPSLSPKSYLDPHMQMMTNFVSVCMHFLIFFPIWLIGVKVLKVWSSLLTDLAFINVYTIVNFFPGYKVYVVQDATRAVARTSSISALQDMNDHGK